MSSCISLDVVGKKYVKGLIGDIKMEFEADFKLDFLSTCEVWKVNCLYVQITFQLPIICVPVILVKNCPLKHGSHQNFKNKNLDSINVHGG